MDIQNNNVTIQINAKSPNGQPLRASDCEIFVVHVFTDDPKRYLTFSKRDMLMTEFVDELTIPRHQMERLNSGVVQYTLDYLPKGQGCIFEGVETEVGEECLNDEHLHHQHPFHDHLIHTRPVVTPIYWRNIHHPHPNFPVNSVTLFDIERLQREIDAEKVLREKDVADLNELFNEGFDSRLNEEIERSKEEDGRLQNQLDTINAALGILNKEMEENEAGNRTSIAKNAEDIANETNRAVTRENQLEQALNTEVTRAKTQEEALTTSLQMEKERATANEQNISTRVDAIENKTEAYKEALTGSVTSEVERAKATESSLNEKINTVSTTLNAEIQRSTEKDIKHTEMVDTETNRAKAVENRLEEALSTEVERAKEAEKHILDEVHTLSDNSYKKTDVDTKVNEINNTISTLKNTVDNHLANAEELTEKVKAISEDVDKAKNDILGEVAKCDAENVRISNDVKVLKESVYTKTEIDDKVSGINSEISEVKSDLTAETARAKAEEKLLSDGLAVVNGTADTVGSIKKALSDAKGYTDLEITKLSLSKDKEISDTLKDYATKSEVEKKITDIIGTAPAALDTLGEIAEALSKDNDTIKAINGVLAEKANKEDVYTKSEVDTAITAVNNTITTLEVKTSNSDTTINGRIDDLTGNVTSEINRAKAEEKKINDKVDGLTDSIDTISAGLTQLTADTAAKDTELENAVNVEKNRAENAESLINSKIDVINGTADTVGSIAHAEKDANHYTDDEIRKLRGEVESGYQPKGEYPTKSEVYTKSEIDDKLSTLDVAVDIDLSEYAKNSEVVKGLMVDGDNGTEIAYPNAQGNVIELHSDDTIDISINKDIVYFEVTDKVARKEDLNDYAGKAEYDEFKTEVESGFNDLNDTIDSRCNTLDAKIDNLENIFTTKSEVNTVKSELTNKIDNDIQELSDLTGNSLGEIYDQCNKKADKSDTYDKAYINTLADTVETKINSKVPIDSFNTWSETVATKEELNNYSTKSEVEELINEIGEGFTTLSEECNNNYNTLNGNLNDYKSEVTSTYATKTALESTNNSIEEVYVSLGEDINTLTKKTNDNKAALDSLTEDITTWKAETENEINQCAKTSETTKVVDGSGNVITSMTIDDSDDDEVEVYTKAQCDARFTTMENTLNSLIRVLTEAEYEALSDEEKNNGIIVVY